MEQIKGILKRFEQWMGEQIREKKLCHIDHRMCLPSSTMPECRQCFDKYMEEA